MRLGGSMLLLSLALTAACSGADGASDAPDTHPGPDVADPADAPDAPDAPDTHPGPDVADPTDVSDVADPTDVPDVSDVADLTDTPDVAPEAAEPPPDTIGPVAVPAIPGARCTPATRVGRVMVYGSAWTPTLDASLEINDRPDAWAPSPELTDAACTFYEEAPPAFCGACPQGTLCAPDGTCQAQSAPVAGVVLTLSVDAATQTFTTTGEPGGAWGTVTLPGRTFAVEVAWGDLVLTLGPTTVPDLLQGTSMTLSGGYDEPSALDLTWTPPVEGATVFTHIPINHHAAGPTYTECAVEASSGALHVDGAMLVPLAVVTGLEFQGIEHVRFAAAETPAGCVEVLFQVHQIVN